MDEVQILDKLIAEIGDEWDNKKAEECPSLKPIGGNYKGVFKGDPMTIPDFPCVGVLPDTEEFIPTGHQYKKRSDLIFQIPFYSYDMEQEDNVDKVVRMAKTIMNIIAANRTLDGLVNVCIIRRFVWTPMIKYGFEESEIRVMGGSVELVVQSFDSE